ncbi:MAG: hypothetical protein RLZZ136_1078 [Pseudomonadota bacterium]|jgi:uncharacterized protein (TIGR02246 family)
MASQTLSDREAIGELKARYCRFLDTKQWDAWRDLFTEDAVLDTSEAGGPPPVIGRAEALAMVRQNIETARTAHQVHTPEITITGDNAVGIWAMQDRLIWPEGHAMTGYGHYCESYVKRDGEWMIAKSKLTRLVLEFTAASGE